MDYTLDGEELNKFLPKFLRSKLLFYGVICLLILRVLSIVISTDFPKNIFFANITTTTLIRFVNQERLSLGVGPLVENKKLDDAALLKAKDMLEKDYFAHQSPEGITPWYWFLKIGYNYKYAGENLAIGFLNSEDVYRAWFDSISHRKNMVNPNYKEIGTAVLTGDYKGNNTTVIVQLFGTSKAKPVPPIVKEKNNTVKSPQVVSEGPIGTEVLSQSVESPSTKSNGIYYRLLNFLLYNSDIIFEYTGYILLVLTATSLLFSILINFNIQDRALILRSCLIMILLFITVFLNKDMVNQIIPHQIII